MQNENMFEKILNEGYYIITPARGGKFKVALKAAGNGEMLMSSEIVESKENAFKNVRACMRANNSSFVYVLDGYNFLKVTFVPEVEQTEVNIEKNQSTSNKRFA
jgi:uncharacterized protein YegP (UPF0339 family)